MISPRNVDGSLPSDGVPFSILPAENNTVCCWDGIMAFLTSENWLVQSRMQDILTSRSNNSGAGPRTAKIGRSISFSHSPYLVQFQIIFVPLFLTIGSLRILCLISEWPY